VQREIFGALETVHHSIPPPSNGHDTHQALRDAISWYRFQFRLLGIGCKKDPRGALLVLYEAGKPENGEFWISLATMVLIAPALDVQVPEVSLQQLIRMTLQGIKGSSFTARVLGTSCMRLYPGPHGVHVDRKFLENFVSHESLRAWSRNSYPTTQPIDITIGHGNTLLHGAVLHGMLDVVKYLVEELNANVNAVNESSETPLLLAVRWNEYDILGYLLDQGADASIGRPDGENALYWLTSLPEEVIPFMARRLRDRGASLEWFWLYGSDQAPAPLVKTSYFYDSIVRGSALLHAIGYENLVVLKTLVQMVMEEYPPPVIVKFLFPPLLQLAAELHLPAILKYLLSQLSDAMGRFFSEGDREHQNQFPDTKEIGALWRNTMKTDIVAGEALQMTSHTVRLCIHREKWKWALESTLQLLLDYGFLDVEIYAFGRWDSALNYAIIAGNEEAVRFMLEKGLWKRDIKAIIESRQATPLYCAIKNRDAQIFKLLVQHGESLDISEESLILSNASYLHFCASERMMDELEIPNIILSHSRGIPATITDKNGVSVLEVAVCRCDFGFAKLLLEKGASPNRIGKGGFTLLGSMLNDDYASQLDDWVKSIE